MSTHSRLRRPESGFTLLELVVAVGIFAMILLVVTAVLLSSDRLQTRTMRRVEVQAGSRQALALMTTELRQAGADPTNPPMGLVAIVDARANLIRVRADTDGDGAIQTTEPSEDVTYIYDDSTGTLLRDPGSGPAVLLNNVTSMELTYFDSANQPLTTLPLSASDAALVHVIGVTLTSEDRDSRPITLSTRILLRNM
jgi:type IV pilus assembly protein PilW